MDKIDKIAIFSQNIAGYFGSLHGWLIRGAYHWAHQALSWASMWTWTTVGFSCAVMLDAKKNVDLWTWTISDHVGVSINGGIQNGWFIKENPIEMDDFRVTPISATKTCRFVDLNHTVPTMRMIFIGKMIGTIRISMAMAVPPNFVGLQ